MSWRFKASKYKNAAPKVPKPDEWVRELSIGSYQVNGQLIKASAAFAVFNADVAGSNLYVTSLSDTGRKAKDCPLLHAHSDLVTDFDFSPFDDGLLATGSQDSLVKLWSIPEGGLKEPLTTPECTLSKGNSQNSNNNKRVENVAFHPVADFLLATSAGTSVTLWDVHKQQELACLSSSDPEGTVIAGSEVQSISWKGDGALLATTSKDKKLRIWDPRGSQMVQDCESHTANNRESVAVWLGSSNRILTSGFDQSRQRQIYVRDVRQLGAVEFSLVFDSSTGLLLPLFDADTQMLFLAGKGDNTIGFYEVNDRDPVLTEGLRHTGQQTKGACLVPKRALKVMDGEVNRVLQLTANALVPISYIVPRKSYREFHSDLFPETTGPDPSIYASQWMTGSNEPPVKMSLDPASNKRAQVFRGPLNERQEEIVIIRPSKTASSVPTPLPRKSVTEDSIIPKPFVAPKPVSRLNSQDNGNGVADRPVAAVRRSLSLRTSQDSNGKAMPPPSTTNPVSSSVKRSDSDRVKNGEEGSMTTAQRRQLFQDRINSVSSEASGSVVDGNCASSSSLVAASPVPKRATRIFGRVSKFRHLHGTIMPRNTHLENFRGLDNALPTECNGFHANPERVAVPLSGPGGRIAILDLKRTGRLPDGPLTAFFNTCKVLDFAWDPFDNRRLAVACEDGRIRLWDVKTDMFESSNEPTAILSVQGSTDRITAIQFHPLASGILASVSADYVVRVWDASGSAEEGKTVLAQTDPHPDQVFGLAWSPCGAFIATVCKDGNIRIFEPRKSSVAIRQGSGPAGVKGARICWALDGKFLLVSGFDKSSQRLLYAFRSTDLSAPLNTLNLDVSPTLLVPYYDEDSSTLFLTGKGDTTIHCYEVSEEAPHFFQLSHHKCSTALQGLALLPKSVCQVKDVEFARFITLTSGSIEPLSFTVPRVKSDYFQDDLFPPTKVTWESAITARQWAEGVNGQLRRLDLKPDNMQTLSSHKAAQSVATTPAAPAPAVVAPSIPAGTNGSGGGFLSAVSARKEREKGAELEAAISSQLEINLALEQDTMQGVDESEWDN